MAKRHVYHWKHGWIPLTHTAAMSKAKGNREKAAELLADAKSEHAGIHKREHVGKAALDLTSIADANERAEALVDVQDAAERLGAVDSLPSALRRPSSAPRDLSRAQLADGTHVQIAREAGKGGDVIAVRKLTQNPITGEVSPASLAAAPYVEHATPDLMRSLGVRDEDLPAVMDLVKGKSSPKTHGGFTEGAHVAYNGRASDGTGTVEGSRNVDGETFLQVRDHKDGQIYEWAPNQVAEISKTDAPAAKSAQPSSPSRRGASQQNEDTAAHWNARADELEALAAAKRAEAQHIADGAGHPDRAAGRLNPKALKQVHRSTDSRLRRYTEASTEARELDHKAKLARARADEAARVRLTHDEIKGATHVRDSNGWHEVVRVNGKSVTVKTGYSWNDTITHDKIHEVRKPHAADPATPPPAQVVKLPTESKVDPFREGARQHVESAKHKVGDAVSIRGQANSRVTVVEIKDGRAKVQHAFQSGAQGTWMPLGKLVPYGSDTGREAPMGGRPVPGTGATGSSIRRR